MWLYYQLDFRFNQLKCKEYGLNNDDLYVLSYLNQLSNSDQAAYKTINGQNWILITARKLEADCILTYWKAKTFKNKLKTYQFLGLIEIYRDNPKSHKMYYRLHLEKLHDNHDQQSWKTCQGIDDTLAWYSNIQKIDKFRNEIKYKNNTYKYSSTGIICSVINKYNKSPNRAYPNSLNSFKNIFESALKRLISKEVFEKYFERSTLLIDPGDTVRLHFHSQGSREAILCQYRYELERALCDSFLYICRDVEAREKLSSFDSNLY